MQGEDVPHQDHETVNWIADSAHRNGSLGEPGDFVEIGGLVRHFDPDTSHLSGAPTTWMNLFHLSLETPHPAATVSDPEYPEVR